LQKCAIGGEAERRLKDCFQTAAAGRATSPALFLPGNGRAEPSLRPPPPGKPRTGAPRPGPSRSATSEKAISAQADAVRVLAGRQKAADDDGNGAAFTGFLDSWADANRPNCGVPGPLPLGVLRLGRRSLPGDGALVCASHCSALSSRAPIWQRRCPGGGRPSRGHRQCLLGRWYSSWLSPITRTQKHHDPFVVRDMRSDARDHHAEEAADHSSSFAIFLKGNRHEA